MPSASMKKQTPISATSTPAHHGGPLPARCDCSDLRCVRAGLPQPLPPAPHTSFPAHTSTEAHQMQRSRPDAEEQRSTEAVDATRGRGRGRGRGRRVMRSEAGGGRADLCMASESFSTRCRASSFRSSRLCSSSWRPPPRLNTQPRTTADGRR
eukprot:3931946-Rhodomonas_salina.3